jgi:hypothetical protein
LDGRFSKCIGLDIIYNFDIVVIYAGCPYRHTDPELLRQRLASHKLGKEGLDEVVYYYISYIPVHC